MDVVNEKRSVGSNNLRGELSGALRVLSNYDSLSHLNKISDDAPDLMGWITLE